MHTTEFYWNRAWQKTLEGGVGDKQTDRQTDGQTHTRFVHYMMIYSDDSTFCCFQDQKVRLEQQESADIWEQLACRVFRDHKGLLGMPENEENLAQLDHPVLYHNRDPLDLRACLDLQAWEVNIYWNVAYIGIFRNLHRRRSSVNFGGKTFCPKNYVWKINKIPEFNLIFARKLFLPEFGGYVLPPSPVSYAYGNLKRWAQGYISGVHFQKRLNISILFTVNISTKFLSPPNGGPSARTPENIKLKYAVSQETMLPNVCHYLHQILSHQFPVCGIWNSVIIKHLTTPYSCATTLLSVLRKIRLNTHFQSSLYN